MLKHTDAYFEQQLNQLNEKILEMGAAVEMMIANADQALVKRDSNLARQVIRDDQTVDQLEVAIDDLCLAVLALHQPTAIDLRAVIVGLKISTDLERVGDLACNICEQVIELNKEEPLKPYQDLPLMAAKSQKMVREALDAFVNRNAAVARKICEADDEVDDLGHRIYSELNQIMENSSEAVRRGIRLIIVSRQLERVADHATNIAESVNFLVKGEDIRHGA